MPASDGSPRGGPFAMRWRLSSRGAREALPLADRHYSRSKPGTPQFVGNGSDVVLLAPAAGPALALWVTKWQRFVRTPYWLGQVVLRLHPDAFPPPAEPADWQRPLIARPRSWANVLSANVRAS